MRLLHGVLKRAGQLIGKNRLSILIYHQVIKDTDPMRPADPDAQTFRWHMKLLRDYFNPVSLSEAVRQLKKHNLPANSVCVTFDDGYLNNFEVAQPILQEFGIPATVFVASGFSDGSNMWNDRLIDLIGKPDITTFQLNALGMGKVNVTDWQDRGELVERILPDLKYREYRKREKIIDALYLENNAREAPRKMMSTQEIAMLAHKGVEIGAHTIDHPILKTLSDEEQRHQIAGSKEMLERLIGSPVNGFAYPNGRPGSDYDTISMQLVDEAGFEYAVSTTWGCSTPGTNGYELNRFTPWDKNPTRFHLRMLRIIMGF
jgi:peptidoglycan/xylan/chitin deacetylase (PgdA/CDA1 family)